MGQSNAVLKAGEPLRVTRRELLLVLTLFAIAVAIRGIGLSLMSAYPDELTYGSRAIVMLAYGWEWPAKFMLDQPPLFMYVLAAVVAVAGGSLETLRLVSVFSGAATVVVVYFVGKSMFGKFAGVFAAVALTLNGFHIEYSRLIYIESFEILLLSLTLLAFWESLKRRSWRLAAVAGLLLGASIDAKYIAFVFPVAVGSMYVIHRRKFASNFNIKQLGIFSGFAGLAFLPVGLDLLVHNQNPFYYDLVGRFSNRATEISAFRGIVAGGGAAVSSGYTALIASFTHVSSQNPFQIFPAYSYELLAWWIVVVITLLYFAASFLYRRRMQDSILLLFFGGFLLFSILYPDKGYYFLLYPVVPILLMFGDLVSTLLMRFRSPRHGSFRLSPVTLGALLILFLSLSAVAVSAAAVPSIYRTGYGDWDEIGPVMAYVVQHEQPNSTIVTNIAIAYYYGSLYGVQSQFASLQRPVYLAFLPASQSVLDIPIRGNYPVFWVISPLIVQELHPQFVIMSRVYWNIAPVAFQQYIDENYYQPLDTKLVLFFVNNNSTAA